jgi:hypothetical protein
MFFRNDFYKAMMPELVDDVIRLYKNYLGKLVKEYDTQGTPGECTEKHTGEATIDHEMYQ